LAASRKKSSLPRPGIIGVPLPAEKLIAALPELAERLGSDGEHFQQVASAIITTDKVEKTAFATFVKRKARKRRSHRRSVQRLGNDSPTTGSACHHAGVYPDRRGVEPAMLDRYLREAIEVSFNRISVDGDTSTNDTVLVLASGASGVDLGTHIACLSPPRLK
jgi:glutamate N-acetyltransferase / amino-acid N-acetyltransferase